MGVRRTILKIGKANRSAQTTQSGKWMLKIVKRPEAAKRLEPRPLLPRPSIKPSLGPVGEADQR